MKIRCKKCDVVFQGEPDDMSVIACTSCGYRMRVRAREDSPGGAPAGPEDASGEKKTRTPSASVPSRTPSASVPSKTPSANVPTGPKLPATMRANKLLAGRQCMGCGEVIALGQEVHNCDSCYTPSHDSCWNTKGGCPNAACPSALAVKKNRAGGGEGGDDAGDGEESKPCKYCGETIKTNARKCRFCGEYQNARDRAAQDKAQKAVATAATDDELQTGDWILCILCSGIGCIVGIVYAIQGKKKGGKMIGISILMNVILRVVLAAIFASIQH